MKALLIVSTCALLCLNTWAQQTKPAVAGATSAPPRTPVVAPVLDDRHKLGSGDRVSYQVIEDQEDPKSLVVGDSGELQIPYFGLVRAANKTCREVAAEIRAALEKDLYHRATVVLAVESVNKTRTVGKIYVSGSVQNGGVQEIPADETYTVGKAILKAGGFSDFSDKKRVRVIRNVNGQKKTFVVNVMDVWEKGKVEHDLVLSPDDAIYVPERLVNF